MYCEKCGNKVNNGDKFCDRCGEPIPYDDVGVDDKTSGVKIKKIVAGALFAIILILCIVIIVIIVNNGNKGITESEAVSSTPTTTTPAITTTTVSVTSTTNQTTSTATTATTVTQTTATSVEIEPEVVNTIPTNLRADNFGEKRQIQVNWNAVEDATQYLVHIFDGQKLVRTECVSETKCIVTGLDDGKQYTFKVQAFVEREWSDFSEEIKAKTISREESVSKELNDYLVAQNSEDSNAIQPVLGSGDLFCTVGDFEIHIKKEESFSGDKTYLGVYHKGLSEWTIPYTTDSEFLTDGRINIDEFMESRNVGTNNLNGGTKIVYEGGTVISCVDYISSIWNYQWYYDFSKDKLLCLFRTGYSKWEYLYHTADDLVLRDSSSVTAFNWDSGEERCIVEGPLEAILDNAILVDIEESIYSSDDDHLALVDYEGEILIDLSEYEAYGYSGSHNTAYNGDKLLAVMEGEESGIYACLINADASLAFEPIKLYEPKYDYSIDLLYLFEDFFVIVRRTEGDTQQGIYFYELDGTQIMKLDLE